MAFNDLSYFGQSVQIASGSIFFWLTEIHLIYFRAEFFQFSMNSIPLSRSMKLLSMNGFRINAASYNRWIESIFLWNIRYFVRFHFKSLSQTIQDFFFLYIDIDSAERTVYGYSFYLQIPSTADTLENYRNIYFFIWIAKRMEVDLR